MFSIHLIASVSLTFPKYRCVIVRFECLKIILLTISIGTPEGYCNIRRKIATSEFYYLLNITCREPLYVPILSEFRNGTSNNKTPLFGRGAWIYLLIEKIFLLTQPDYSGQRTHKNTFVTPDNGQIKRLSKKSFPGFVLDASYAVFVSFGSGNRFIGGMGNLTIRNMNNNPDRERILSPCTGRLPLSVYI